MSPAQVEAFVERGCRDALKALALPASAEVKPRPERGREPLKVALTPDAPDRLGPRRWQQVAQALQVLLDAALAAAGHADVTVAVLLPEAASGRPQPGREVEGLEAAARALAEASAARGRSFALGPMSVGDRRLVHQALGDLPAVWTRSDGEGIFRRLWVVPRPMMPRASDAGPEAAGESPNPSVDPSPSASEAPSGPQETEDDSLA